MARTSEQLEMEIALVQEARWSLRTAAARKRAQERLEYLRGERRLQKAKEARQALAVDLGKEARQRPTDRQVLKQKRGEHPNWNDEQIANTYGLSL